MKNILLSIKNIIKLLLFALCIILLFIIYIPVFLMSFLIKLKPDRENIYY